MSPDRLVMTGLLTSSGGGSRPVPGWVWMLVLLLSAPALRAGPALNHRADEVKAAFILNIARFVEWPAENVGDEEQALRLCLYRHNPLGAAIETIRGKQVAGRVLDIQTVDDAVEGQSCHILFIPPSQMERFSRDGTGFAHLPLLTITDLTAGRGSRPSHPDILIFLVRDDTRIGLEINLGAVRRSGLQVSSELLKLGRIADGD